MTSAARGLCSLRALFASAFIGLVASAAALAGGCTPPPPLAINVLLSAHNNEPTVVEFVDYQCGYCRRAHALVAPKLDHGRRKIHLSLVHVPLRSHPFADSAARASICAGEQGKELVAHNALMEIPPAKFAREHLPELAAGWGLEAQPFAECLDSQKTNDRLTFDRNLFIEQGYSGVPVLWVGRTMFDGVPPLVDLEAAFDVWEK